MTERFFVTGLPRSRTAWMAAYLSTERALCYHEPIATLDSLEALAALYDSPFYSHIGVSDSGLGFRIGWILEHLAPRTLIIERPLRDVEQSLAQLGFPATNQAALLQRELDRWSDHPLVKRIAFSALDNPRAMERAFFHLVPGIPFDAVRHREFCHLNIQTDLAQLRQRVKGNTAGMQRILGDVYQHVRRSSG